MVRLRLNALESTSTAIPPSYVTVPMLRCSLDWEPAGIEELAGKDEEEAAGETVAPR